MTEFTSEFIASERLLLNLRDNKYDWSNYKSLQALDEIERLQAENAEIKHLCVFALHGLGKLSYEQWHTGDWVHDEIWTKYRKIADEVYNEFGKKYKALKRRVQELEQEHTWISVSDPAVFELERGFYLYEDERGAHMIGLFNFTDRNLLGATKIYSMKLYPPHLKNIPQPTKEDI